MELEMENIFRGLAKMAKSCDLDVHTVEENYHRIRHKLYKSAYKKEFIPKLSEQDIYAHKIVQRFFRIHYKIKF